MIHLALALGAALLVQAAGPAPAPVQATVGIDFVATGRDHAPLADLGPDDVEVWIAGRRAPIVELRLVTPEVEGRTVVLLLDDTAAGPVLAGRIREAARLFVGRMGPADRMAVVPLRGAPMVLTESQAELRQAVGAYSPQGFPFRVEDAAGQVLRTVAALSRQVLERPGRKTIAAIGVGWMFDAPVPPPGLHDVRPEWVAALRALAAARASLYVIDPTGVGAAPAVSGSSGFAADTGGYGFTNTNDVAGAVSRIWGEAGTYYLLRVGDPPAQRGAELREVEVRPLREGVTIRARRYIAGGG